MSLPQYWKVYEEFNSRNDNFVVKSLRDKTHVELLDTIILNKSIVQNGRFERNCDRRSSSSAYTAKRLQSHHGHSI